MAVPVPTESVVEPVAVTGTSAVVHECPLPTSELSEVVRRYVLVSTPTRVRMMAAKGISPMPPRDVVTPQFVLTFDPDAKVSNSASSALLKIDDRLARSVLGDTAVSSHVLGYLARGVVNKDGLAEQLLLNPAAPSEAFVAIAGAASERICKIIANNQQKILDAPEIVCALYDNPNALASTKDRVLDFVVRSGLVIEGFKPWEDAYFRLGGKERKDIAATVVLPAGYERLLDESTERRLIAEDEDAVDELDDNQSLDVMLRSLNAAQKIALATNGNRSARSALLRDTNRLVALAAITSPSITESEVVAAAQSRTVHQDVIAHIGRDKKANWIRNYSIKKALVENPKYPLPDAMKLVPTLNPSDLKMVAKSRMVPVGVRNLATNLVRAKRR